MSPTPRILPRAEQGRSTHPSHHTPSLITPDAFPPPENDALFKPVANRAVQESIRPARDKVRSRRLTSKRSKSMQACAPATPRFESLGCCLLTAQELGPRGSPGCRTGGTARNRPDTPIGRTRARPPNRPRGTRGSSLLQVPLDSSASTTLDSPLAPLSLPSRAPFNKPARSAYCAFRVPTIGKRRLEPGGQDSDFGNRLIHAVALQRVEPLQVLQPPNGLQCGVGLVADPLEELQETAALAERDGFTFLCHAIGHSVRPAPMGYLAISRTSTCSIALLPPAEAQRPCRNKHPPGCQ